MNAHAILVTVSDRLGLLSGLSKALADHQANITYVDIHSAGAASDIYFEFTKPEGGIDDLLAELAGVRRRASRCARRRRSPRSTASASS